MENSNLLELDIVDIYYTALSRVRILGKKEEKDLLIRYKESTDPEEKASIKELVVSSNLRLVFGFAKNFWDQKDADKLQELIAQGNIGLLLALEKFEPKYNVRFCTYAGHWVLMTMRKAHIGLIKANGKPLIIEEETSIPEKPYVQDFDSSIENIQHRYILNTWIRFLSDREKYIINNSFSLKDPSKPPKSLRDMATTLNLSSERVRQLKSQALDKLALWLTYHY